VGRIWREDTRTVLLLYLLLELLDKAYVYAEGDSFLGGGGVQLGFVTLGAVSPGGYLLGLALTVFLVWRVWRGGPFSWTILLLLSGLSVVMTGIAAVMAGGDAYPVVLLGFSLASLLLIGSPAARLRLG
jgi:hypothetical protein